MVSKEEQEAWEKRKKEIRSRHPRLFPRPVGFACPPTWAEVLEDTFRQLEEAAERMDLPADAWPQITDVKEKYGGLRIYYQGCSLADEDVFDQIIEAAEERIERTCVKCGAPGRIGPGGMWSYCDEHMPESEHDYIV